MTDRLLRYLTEDDHAIALVDATETCRTIGVDQHHLHGRPLGVLARGVVSAVLLGTRMKGRGLLSWDLRTEGLFRQLRVDAMGQGLVRAMVAPETEQELDEWNGVDELLGDGQLVLSTRIEGQGQGYTTTLEVTAEHVDGVTNDYLQRSAQVSAVVRSDVRIEGDQVVAARGIYLERLPGADPEQHPDGLTDTVERWREAGMGSLDLVAAGEPDQVIAGLIGADGWRRLHEAPVQFHCPCSRERYVSTLAGFPPDELRQLVNGAGVIVARCDFCGAVYNIPLDEVI